MNNVLTWLLKDKSGDPLLRLSRILLVIVAIAGVMISVAGGALGKLVLVMVFSLGMLIATWAIGEISRSRKGVLAVFGKALAVAITLGIAGLFIATLSYLVSERPAAIGRVLGVHPPIDQETTKPRSAAGPATSPPAVCKEIKNISELGWRSGHKHNFCVARGYTSVTNIQGSDYRGNGGGWCFTGDLEACNSRIRGGL